MEQEIRQVQCQRQQTTSQVNPFDGNLMLFDIVTGEAGMMSNATTAREMDISQETAEKGIEKDA